MQVFWSITPEKIDAAVRQIVNLVQPRKVILFGSVVAGKPHIHSDVNILVVTGDEVESSRKAGVRIRRALRGISMPMNILVIPEERLQELVDEPGLANREAVRHGKVVYEAAE